MGGPKVQDSYLNIPAIISAAEITNADAIHPGYGFFAENQNFVKICKEHDIKFIGPTAEMIEKMGDKASARALMKKAGVPIIPGSDGLVKDVKQGLKIAKEIGFPVILKATAGGGGKGMREVWKEEDFETAWNLASSEAQASFSNGSLYLEKFIEDPKHIEIQVIGDSYGNAAHLSERDCSIQRRHQKLVEETPSPIMTNALRKKMGEAAVKAVKAAKYNSVGTIEFLVDKHKNFYFMEMNTRIQVEHTITEEVISYDLVKEQIKVAMGERISGRNYIPKLHAMECRINAEDPYDDFKPSPGKITSLHLPGGHGIRIDTHVYQGYVIPPFYDSMIGKLIAIGQTREEVIQTMRRALEEFVIEGVETTIPFHLKLLNDPDFIAGKYTTKFMEDFKM